MRIFILILGLAFITGCSTSIDGERYRDIQPGFDVNDFFDGKVKAWGIVQDRDGNMVQRFEVDIIGTNQDGVLTLDETFVFSVGEGLEKRIWKIESRGNNQFVGTAGDILGEAQGEVFGNAMQWKYEMDLPVDDATYRVQFDDWFWAFDENTIMNRSYIKKFGLTMADITIFMQKQP